MAGPAEPLLVAAPREPESVAGAASQQDQEAVSGADSQASAPATPSEDFRVRCTSKKAVTEVMELCGRFVQRLGDALPADIRELALRDVQWTFESAVQENVSINGQAWQEASDNCFMDSDIKVLEDEFDEIIVDTATKRKQYPRKILECVIRTLKAQHETLKQYHPVVQPLDLHSEPASASVENLKCRGEAVAKKISEAMKALPALIEQGDGFSQVLKMQPVIQLQRIHQEVFSGCHGTPGVQPESFVAAVETTPPTEAASRKSSNVVLKRKPSPDCAQRRCYPLRPKRISLGT